MKKSNNRKGMYQSPLLDIWKRHRRHSISVPRPTVLEEPPTLTQYEEDDQRTSATSVGHFSLPSTRDPRRLSVISHLSHISQLSHSTRVSDSSQDEHQRNGSVGSSRSIGTKTLLSYRTRMSKELHDIEDYDSRQGSIRESDEFRDSRLFTIDPILARRLKEASVFQRRDMESESDSSAATPKKTKKLRFDPANLKETYHPQMKTYGLMTIHETKTPYPRVVEPVDPRELRKRLQLSILRHKLHTESDGKESPQGSPPSRLFSEPTVGPSQEFRRKRKKFYQDEFTLTKQCMMNDKVHTPLESLHSAWRENQSFISTVQSRIEFGDYLPLLSRQFDGGVAKKSLVDEDNSASSTSDIDASNLIATTKF